MPQVSKACTETERELAKFLFGELVTLHRNLRNYFYPGSFSTYEYQEKMRLFTSLVHCLPNGWNVSELGKDDEKI